jgi:hypothetical protein
VRCAAAKPRVNAEKPRFFINAQIKYKKIKKESYILWSSIRALISDTYSSVTSLDCASVKKKKKDNK